MMTMLTILPGIEVIAEDRIPVDTKLVLAMDCSSSIQPDEWFIQVTGTANAISDLEIVRLISLGKHGRIAVIAICWSHDIQQKVTVEWSIISNQAEAEEFAEKLRAVPHSYKSQTHVGPALRFATALLQTSPYVAERSVIDISGDDSASFDDNTVEIERQRADQLGFMINALTIGPRNHGVHKFYRERVIAGEGAFIEEVYDGKSLYEFVMAMKRKLTRELKLGV